MCNKYIIFVFIYNIVIDNYVLYIHELITQSCVCNYMIWYEWICSWVSV